MSTVVLIVHPFSTLGVALAAQSLEAGHQVVLFGQTNEEASVVPSAELLVKVHVVQGSARNQELFRTTVETYKVDYVIDLWDWTVAGRERSAEDSARRSLLGLVRLLNGLRASSQHSIRGFLYVSSTEVYGDGDFASPRETNVPLRPRTVAGAVFASAEALLHSYQVSYRLPLSVVRLDPTTGSRVAAKELLSTAQKALPRQIYTIESSGSEVDVAEKKEEKTSGLSRVLVLTSGADTESKPIGSLIGAIGSRAGATVTRSPLKVGQVSDAELRAHLLQSAPSHVLLVLDETTTASPDHNAKEQLSEDARSRLYAGWALASICADWDIHLTVLFPSVPPRPHLPWGESAQAAVFCSLLRELDHFKESSTLAAVHLPEVVALTDRPPPHNILEASSFEEELLSAIQSRRTGRLFLD